MSWSNSDLKTYNHIIPSVSFLSSFLVINKEKTIIFFYLKSYSN